jgi:hypothetical protein
MKNETSILSRLLKLLPIYPIVNHKLARKPSVEEHWARTVMNREVREMISRLYPDNLESLEISGTTWSNMSFKSYKSIHYPDFDICESSLDEMFDLIIAEQVFEHLLWPYRAYCVHTSSPKPHSAPPAPQLWGEFGAFLS